MPKIKTHTGAKKRFKVSKSGKIKMSHAGRRHILNKKSTKRKRAMRKAGYVDVSNSAQVMRLIPYAR
ncbi:MAG: 50S ribosomal protein L35 [Clostridia bacterium]